MNDARYRQKQVRERKTQSTAALLLYPDSALLLDLWCEGLVSERIKNAITLEKPEFTVGHARRMSDEELLLEPNFGRTSLAELRQICDAKVEAPADLADVTARVRELVDLLNAWLDGHKAPIEATPVQERPVPSIRVVDDRFTSVRVVDRLTACGIIGISDRTLDRMIARGEAPPVTQLSRRRIGYRVSDLQDWLAKRVKS